jgi:hypothetical protein
MELGTGVSLFSRSDADKILSMPLSFCSVSDCVAWPLTKNRNFHDKISICNRKMQGGAFENQQAR